LTAEPPGRARTCIRSVALRNPKVRPLANVGTEILAKNASSGRTNSCYMAKNTIDGVVLINSSTLSVIGVEESNADAVGDCSYVKAIV